MRGSWLGSYKMQIEARQDVVQVLETEIFWEETGAGRPLVLLHGLNDSHRTWRRVLPALARSHRVLTPDLPGYGLSGRPDASYALPWHAHVLGTWLEALDLEDVDLVGHSFGGGVAQFMLLEFRPRIRRLGLVASGGLGQEIALELRLATLPYVVELLGQPFMAPATRIALWAAGAVLAAEEVAWLRRVNATPGTARAFARTARDVIDWRGQRRHFLDRAREIGDLPPMALYWGDRDRVIPVAHGRATAAMLEGVALTTFPGCGHFPHQQCPERFVQALAAFLDAADVSPVRLRGADSALAAAPGVRSCMPRREC
jgi:pimeloyl-ACP methyl ester carboxylesterase